jgi:O-acetyl-ADP-ribose deacetylase (regulator of RNase III)
MSAVHAPGRAEARARQIAAARLSILASLEFLRRECMAAGDIGAQCTARLLERVAAEATTAINEAEIDLLGGIA